MAEGDHGYMAPVAARDLEYSDSEDHFSDAHSGLETSSPTSPVLPLPRVQDFDSGPSHGELSETKAFNSRGQYAQTDELAVSKDNHDEKSDRQSLTPTPGGHPIPTTSVEMVDPSSPSHGEVPGTLAHEKRAADAVPDIVVRSSGRSRSSSTRSRALSAIGDLSIPITEVENVDSEPNYEEMRGTNLFKMGKTDAEQEIIEDIQDEPGSPTSRGARSSIISNTRRESSGVGGTASAAADDYNEEEDGAEAGFGDEFDDFEEGEEDAEFGDFDDNFPEPEPTTPLPQTIPPAPSFPVLDFAELHSAEDIHSETEPYMNAIFPPDTIDTSVLTTTSAENPIFRTPRSASLWSQLVAPPPLQPPNWIRSRIRRLFLVSLGVPVDLDEILPASKQKKLILPSIHLNRSPGSPRTSSDSRSILRLKQSDENNSSTSVDSQGKPSRSDSRRRKGPAPAPQLDLVSARQLCTITDEALNGLTVEELKEHVKKLEVMERTAIEVLEYWTKRTDEKLGDREAFEGVIENLVQHARKVRK